MRGDNYAELFRQRQRGVKFFIADSERAFISEKDFETTQSALHDLFEITLRFIVIARHAHVKREIARALPVSFAQPKFECFERLLISRRTNHFDEGSRPANERRATRGL